MHRPISGVASSKCCIYHGRTPRKIQPRQCIFNRGRICVGIAATLPAMELAPLNRLPEGSWADY